MSIYFTTRKHHKAWKHFTAVILLPLKKIEALLIHKELDCLNYLQGIQTEDYLVRRTAIQQCLDTHFIIQLLLSRMGGMLELRLRKIWEKVVSCGLQRSYKLRPGNQIMSKRLNDRAEAFPAAHPIIVPLRDKSYCKPWVEKIPSVFTCTLKKNENLAL